LTINSGESICTYGTDLSFDAQEVKMDSGYTFQSNFSGTDLTNTWTCTDRAAEKTWDFYVYASDLVLSGQPDVTVSSGKIAIQYTAGITEGDDTDCTVANAASWNPLSGDVIMMTRAYNTK